MSKFVRLTYARSEQPGWVNLDLVQCMRRMAPSRATTYSPDLPERTLVVFGPPDDGDPFSNSVEVIETPERILAIADPENACPDPPGACGYYTHYLAYGGPDLTHAGFHAAVAIHERHATTCGVSESGRVCSVCTAGESRIRA